MKTTLSASRSSEELEAVREALERQDDGLGHVDVVEQRQRLGHVRRRRRAHPDDGQLPPIDIRRGDRPGVGEDEHRAAGRDRLERRVDAAPAGEHDGVDGPVGRATRPPRVGVDREHLVAATREHRSRTAAR